MLSGTFVENIARLVEVFTGGLSGAPGNDVGFACDVGDVVNFDD